ncbi:hypothetical protein T492DRAFT_866181 [Pavlovales sp. CCMP2436]|nr:hypothetical protein T492DRAFT_866181 [Pavlovales sp. CCMP2436]
MQLTMKQTKTILSLHRHHARELLKQSGVYGVNVKVLGLETQAPISEEKTPPSPRDAALAHLAEAAEKETAAGWAADELRTKAKEAAEAQHKALIREKQFKANLNKAKQAVANAAAQSAIDEFFVANPTIKASLKSLDESDAAAARTIFLSCIFLSWLTNRGAINPLANNKNSHCVCTWCGRIEYGTCGPSDLLQRSYSMRPLYPYGTIRLVMETVPDSCNLYRDRSACCRITQPSSYEPERHVREAAASVLYGCHARPPG